MGGPHLKALAGAREREGQRRPRLVPQATVLPPRTEGCRAKSSEYLRGGTDSIELCKVLASHCMTVM